MSRRLQILSASLTSLASGDRWGACSIWRSLRVALSRLRSSLTSTTTAAMRGPKCSASSSAVVQVSSMVSWSIAALSTTTSSTRPSLASTSARAIGWLM